jgi:hypothetical protein
METIDGWEEIKIELIFQGPLQLENTAEKVIRQCFTNP